MLEKLVKTFTYMVIAATFSIVPSQVYAANSALLELIQILKNKGSISDEEYQLLQKAAAEDNQQPSVSTQNELVIKPETESAVVEVKPASSSWTENVSIKSDIRLRYQNEQEGPGTGRDRDRIRYRLGVTARPTAGWEVGGGLASGDKPDGRSTNQSFTDSFTKKLVSLDYAYAQYKFNDRLALIAGKFRAPAYLYMVSDLLWDTDINPEGVSVSFNHKSDLGSTFANSGMWVLGEKSTSAKDPYMAYLQLGQTFSADNLFGTVVGTYYTFEDITALNDFPTTGSNTDFHFGGIYSLAGEIGITGLLVDQTRFSLVGDWIKNADTNTDADNGYLIGLKTAYRLWSFRYNYVNLEHNAWPDIFPDADRYSGFTGIRGHEFIFEYEIMKNVLLGLDYYMSEKILTDTDQDLLQVDLNVRF